MTRSDLPVAGTVVVVRTTENGLEALLMRRPDRGSFPGAWVFPGGKVETVDRQPGASEEDDARRAGIRETREEVGLDVDDLVTLSEWEPPVGIPTRIRTWFFLAGAPDQRLILSEDEVAAAEWVAPVEALARHAAGEWTLFPPTWMTLHRLTAFDDAASALGSEGDATAFRTRIDGTRFHWDAGVLETASLPWTFAPVSSPAAG